MRPETKAKLSDLWVFLKYTFNIKDVLKLLTTKRNVLWGLFIFFSYVMLGTNLKKNYLFVGGFLIIFFLILLVPLYKSGDHRAWARSKYGYSLKENKKKYKEVQNDRHTNCTGHEGMPTSVD